MISGTKGSTSMLHAAVWEYVHAAVVLLARTFNMPQAGRCLGPITNHILEDSSCPEDNMYHSVSYYWDRLGIPDKILVKIRRSIEVFSVLLCLR